MGECFANSLSSSAKQQITDEFGQNISIVQSQNAFYTINGILEFLQSEWAKMEMERSQWEVERAELQTRIAFLQGECKGQENLKNDLVRRIKMLEYALAQERNKNFELKYPNEKRIELPNIGNPNSLIESELNSAAQKAEDDNARWREERIRLREYLVNIGLGDAMSQLRNARVCDILGLKCDTEDNSLNNERLICSSTKNSEVISPQSSMDNSSSESTKVETEKICHSNTVVESPAFVTESDGTEVSSGFEDALDISDPETADALAEFEMLVAQQTASDKRLATDVLQSGMPLVNTIPKSIHKDWDSMDQKELLSRFKEQYRADRSKSTSQLRTVLHSGPKPYLDHHDLLDGSELNIEYPGSPMDGDIDVKRPIVQPNLNLSTNETLMSDELDGISAEFDVLLNDPGQTTANNPPSELLKSPHSHKPPTKHLASSGSVATPLGLGDLASLTVANESDSVGHARAVAVAMDNLDGVGDFMSGRPSPSTDSQALNQKANNVSRVQNRPPWTAKYTLRSHFDSIRAIGFHPSEPILVTASEDHTLKLWNLNKTVQAKKSTSFDVESIYTFRGHNSPVLSLALLAHGPSATKADSSSAASSPSSSSITVYSGDLNGHLRVWRLPNLQLDPYDTYDPAVVGPLLRGHTDAIWSLAVRPDGILLSASADGTARLWQTTSFESLSSSSSHSSLSVYQLTTSLMTTSILKSDDFFSQAPVPTSIAFMPTYQSQFTAGFTSGQIGVFDMETTQLVTRFHATPGKTDPSTNVPDAPVGKPNAHVGSVMSVATHPNYPMVIGAHEDRQIRFYDPTSGKCVHSMVAHLDAVTSLSIDPQGSFLLSASHDCSIRLWDLTNKTCVQEITSHRKKFGESIHAVAFHPTKHFMASAGSDALAKVFV